MSREVCREIFYHGTRSCDLALVEGKYAEAIECPAGGHLDALCDWLTASSANKQEKTHEH